MIFVKLFQSILIYISFPSLLYGQSPYYPLRVPYLSSAKIGDNFTNAMNAAFNPSVIPYLNNIEGGLYAEKKFMTETDLLLLTVCAPFNNNGITLLFQHYGNPAFSERIMGVGYAKNFGKINAGILFQSVNVKVQGLSGDSFFQTGIFSTIKLSETVFSGIAILNPALSKKPEKDKLHAASSYSLTIGWQPSGITYAGMESKKEDGRPLSVIFTLQYQFAEKFYGSMNWTTSGNQPFVCFGWKLFPFVVETGVSFHNPLGASPSISLVYKKTS